MTWPNGVKLDMMNTSIRHIFHPQHLHLHEPAQPENNVVQANVFEIFLCAPLDLHQWDFWVLLAVVNGEEDELLYAHCFGALYEGHFPIPVNL